MKLRLDREYMSESYDQFRKYGSRWLLAERLLGVVFILSGTFFYLTLEGGRFAPVLLIFLGFFELASNSVKKYFWLRRHEKSKLMNAEIEMEISGSGIDSSGPFSSGHFNWDGLEKAVRTPDGVLLWPQKGVYWYLPERIAGSEMIALILSKVA